MTSLHRDDKPVARLAAVLRLKAKLLTGRVATPRELRAMREALGGLLPAWLPPVLSRYKLIGTEFVLADDEDASGLGVEMEWLEPAQIVSEMIEAQPGMAASAGHYLEVGGCLLGSGDPYFIHCVGGDPALVRVPHTAVTRTGALRTKSIETVTRSLSSFLAKTNVS